MFLWLLVLSLFISEKVIDRFFSLLPPPLLFSLRWWSLQLCFFVFNLLGMWTDFFLFCLGLFLCWWFCLFGVFCLGFSCLTVLYEAMPGWRHRSRKTICYYTYNQHFILFWQVIPDKPLQLQNWGCLLGWFPVLLCPYSHFLCSFPYPFNDYLLLLTTQMNTVIFINSQCHYCTVVQ